MNVLEHLATEELARVPDGPSADELRRRARVRRARRTGSVVAVAIVFAVLGVAAMLQSPRAHKVDVVAPASDPTTTTAASSPTSVATAAEFPPLERIVTNVLVNVNGNTDPQAAVATPTSAEIVATTLGQVNALDGVGTANPQRSIYLVQLSGSFVCNECRGLAVSRPRTGTSIRLEYDQAGDVVGFAFGAKSYDLSTLGTVYRLDLTPPLATTAEFPALDKIINNVAGNVTANSDPKAVLKAPISAEIVATTDTKAWAIWGGTQTGKPIYVVQVTGKFECNSCSRPATATTSIQGTALQVFFDASGGGFGMGMSPEPKDLSGLGKVYRLPLP